MIIILETYQKVLEIPLQMRFKARVIAIKEDSKYRIIKNSFSGKDGELVTSQELNEIYIKPIL